jgi:hypothetical protein
MLEGVVAGFLGRLFGRYVDNLDADKLTVSITSGNVELKDLNLRKDAIADFDLPISLCHGSIGLVENVLCFCILRAYDHYFLFYRKAYCKRQLERVPLQFACQMLISRC